LPPSAYPMRERCLPCGCALTPVPSPLRAAMPPPPSLLQILHRWGLSVLDPALAWDVRFIYLFMGEILFFKCRRGGISGREREREIFVCFVVIRERWATHEYKGTACVFGKFFFLRREQGPHPHHNLTRRRPCSTNQPSRTSTHAAGPGGWSPARPPSQTPAARAPHRAGCAGSAGPGAGRAERKTRPRQRRLFFCTVTFGYMHMQRRPKSSSQNK